MMKRGNRIVDTINFLPWKIKIIKSGNTREEIITMIQLNSNPAIA